MFLLVTENALSSLSDIPPELTSRSAEQKTSQKGLADQVISRTGSTDDRRCLFLPYSPAILIAHVPYLTFNFAQVANREKRMLKGFSSPPARAFKPGLIGVNYTFDQHRFTQRIDRRLKLHAIFLVFSRAGGRDAWKVNNQHGTWVEGYQGLPCLLEAPANVSCSVLSATEVGSHTVFLGEVRDIALSGETRPLIYQEGNLFRTVSVDAVDSKNFAR